MEHPSPPSGPVSETRRLIFDAIRDTGVPLRDFVPISPILVTPQEQRALQFAATALLDLCRRTVLYLSDSTAGRLDAYGADSTDYPLFTSDTAFEEGLCDVFARPDFILTDDGPCLLEFNVSGAIGGVPELSTMQAGLRAAYGRRRNVSWSWSDPYRDRARAFGRISSRHGFDRTAIVVGSVRDMKHTSKPKIFDLEVEALRDQGFAAEFVEPDSIDSYLEAAPTPKLGLRMFTVPEWAEAGIELGSVRRLLDRGCWLLGPQSSAFLANKKTLAFLSEGMPWMTRRDHALVTQYLPWTRLVGDRQTTNSHGDQVDLLPYCLQYQDSLVLKEAIGMQGMQVTIGSECSAAQWEESVHRAASDGGSIIQRLVTPTTRAVWLSHGDAESDNELVRTRPIVSYFVFDGQASGGWARFRPDDSYGIVSREGFGAFETAVHGGSL